MFLSVSIFLLAEYRLVGEENIDKHGLAAQEEKKEEEEDISDSCVRVVEMKKNTLLQFKTLDNKGHSEIRVKDNATLKFKRKTRIYNARMHFPNYLDSYILRNRSHVFIMTRLLKHFVFFFVFRFTVASIIIVWPLSSPIMIAYATHTDPEVIV